MIIDEKYLNNEYKYGFKTNIPSLKVPKGLNESIIKFISKKKEEPEWMLKKRLLAYKFWKNIKQPKWGNFNTPEINFQDIHYYAEPYSKKKIKDLNEIDPELLKTYAKLGIPLQEQKILSGVAVDAVFDSVSIATTYKTELKKHGIIFCSMSEAVKKHPTLVMQYFCSVVPQTDNFFATLNSAVFSDGTFVYIPKNTKCPMELSTYFRINEAQTGQFERTLIIADQGSEVSYLEGCTAPMRNEKQLHAAVVELVALEDAKIKYATVQNWYPGNKNGQGGIYNFVTKRGLCKGAKSIISWTQLETGSAITWKYPSCILQGDHAKSEFYSIALTNNYQKSDTGTKMVHLGNNTRSKIIAKGISAGNSINTYRGMVTVAKKAHNTRNFTQCDSLLLGRKSLVATIPYIETRNNSAHIEHEATTSEISKKQLYYCLQRGLNIEEATSLIINGFCQTVLNHLPMEFAIEAKNLLKVSLEGAIG